MNERDGRRGFVNVKSVLDWAVETSFNCRRAVDFVVTVKVITLTVKM
jgi:hypothetical protein